MDLVHGRHVLDEIMNNPAYGPSGSDDEDVGANDPLRWLKLAGLGKPGAPPLPRLLSPHQVRSQALPLSQEILNLWAKLHRIVANWDTTMQKRWLKKTKEQRKKILLGAWPGMPTIHRPDFDAFKNKKMPTSGPCRRPDYLWPHINQEDLIKPRSLPLLLNSRGYYPPAAFSTADRDSYRFGVVSRAIDVGFLNEYVMMFTDRHTPMTYGELIAWEDNPDAFYWLHSQRGFQPGDGLLVLEIQARLYKFCVDCCKNILHDKSIDELESITVPAELEPVLVSGNESGLASLAAAAAEAPYRLPMNLNLDRLKSMLAAKLEDAEDHLWALREDPGYFAAQLTNAKEHRLEHISDKRGRKHPIIEDRIRNSTLWQRVICSAVTNAYLKIELWNVLLGRAVELQALKEKHNKDISLGKDLPEEYAMAFYKFMHHLKQLAKGPIGVLKQGAFGSPPLRIFFEREPQNPNNTIIQIRRKGILTKNKVRDELIWLLTTLFDEDQLFLLDLGILMDELDRLLESESTAKELISSWVADKISDLAVISQCIQQIRLYQPWAAEFANRMAENTDVLDEDYSRTDRLFAEILIIKVSDSTAALGASSDSRFYYPIDKRRTRENTESMRIAEKNLDDFWRAVDGELVSNGAVISRVRRLLDGRMLQRTQEWVEPSKGEQMEAVSVLPYSLAEEMLHLERSTTSTLNAGSSIVPKNKTKTRGTSELTIADAEAVPQPVEPMKIDRQPKFQVDKRAHKVFKTIFFAPSASSQPGEVAWADFLHAMGSVGFNIEKLYGSAWQFTPTNLDVERAIQFHEPHPIGKIPFVSARRIGRRISRAYGWYGGMFVAKI